ncbi:MAG: hypothetical protein K5885_01470 [Bacteroidales bacterium]|nr:hypothetical protein [Bacteroidales bacterium]
MTYMIWRNIRHCLLAMALLVLLADGVAYAQDEPTEPCVLNVDYRVQDATCYYNGQIQFAILNEQGQPMTEAEFVASGLSSVRIFYRLTPNSSHQFFDPEGGYHGGYSYVLVDGGTYYEVGVEAYRDSDHVKCATINNPDLLVNRFYTEPTATAIGTTAYTNNGYGRHPSLVCDSTGRIQLKIQNGKLPFTVRVVNSDDSTDVFGTMVFGAPNYPQTGTDSALSNYKDYYTIDGLPPGNWNFYVEDGCGYGLPYTSQTVASIEFPELDYVEVFAAAATDNLFLDSNMVKINAVLSSSYDYYNNLLSNFAQYRIIVGDTTNSTVLWKPFPSLSGTNKTTLYEEVTSVQKYCDLWDRDITLQYKVNRCDDTVISRTFQLHKPDENRYRSSSVVTVDSISDQSSCLRTRYTHTSAFTITYPDYQPTHIEKYDDDDIYRNHYTHPLVWTYTDENNQLIQSDTVDFLNSVSKLTEDSVKAFFHLDDLCGQTITITRTLTDGKGCQLYTTTDDLTFECPVSTSSPSWTINTESGDHCCQLLNKVRIVEQNSTSANADGTIIELIRSPYSNRYNFRAEYRASSHVWDISGTSFENSANLIGSPDGRSFEVSDYCLPSGTYVFHVTTACGEKIITKQISFPDIYSTELTEEPAYSVRELCSDIYIKYTAGTVSRVSRNTSPSTGLPLNPVIQPLTTYFKVVEGPYGGYDNTTYRKGDEIHISIPGVYVVHIYPDPQAASQLCEVPDFYDTIVYPGGTLQFDFAYALLCNEDDTVGSVYVKAKNGLPPYTYTLFSGSEITSDTLGTQTLDAGIIAQFDTTIHYDEELLCMISNGCGAYFPVRFYPRTIAEMQKIWFDNGLQVETTCEGSKIQVHALEIGSVLEYHWYDPNDSLIDSVSSPYLFVPRGAVDGYYKVEIRQSTCDTIVRDSVLLLVDAAPTLDISEDVLVCPGEPAIFTFTPFSEYLSALNSDEPIQFQIAFETAAGITVRSYESPHNVPVIDTFVTTVPAKIYPLMIDDYQCDYTVADDQDTAYIFIKGNENKQCLMRTTNDTVCYNGNGHVEAWNTAPSYILHWYGDYMQTHKLKDDTLVSGEVSQYDTNGLKERTILYVSIEEEGGCSAVNGITVGDINLHSDTTQLVCGMSLRLYDPGGNDGDYTPDQNIWQTFHTMDGRPVTLKFDELNLSNTSHLYVISGARLERDSVLYDLTAGSVPPEIIVANSDTMTLYFIPGHAAASGWSAIVEHEPGIAIIDVWNRNHVYLNDEVCQQASYNDIYDIVGGEIATAAELNNAVHNAGTYVFSDTVQTNDSHGCDSIVTFTLKVNPPDLHESQQVLLRVGNTFYDADGHSFEGGYVWEGQTYTTSGVYRDTTVTASGCDSINKLTLIVLEAEVSDDEICIGQSTVLGVSVNTNDSIISSLIVQPIHAPGDVLCMVGNEMRVMRPEELLESSEVTEVLGVVFYMDPNNQHGKAISLRNAYDGRLGWAKKETRQLVHAGVKTADFFTALNDLQGLDNTLWIKSTAENIASSTFQESAPAAYYAYYYDHRTQRVGTDSLGWYLPSCGELSLAYSQQSVVNKTLNMLAAQYNAMPLDVSNKDNNYWSSTEATNTNAWKINGSGQLIKHLPKEDEPANVRLATYVRAIYSF